jgi:apolipoprotein N-acyltransferase
VSAEGDTAPAGASVRARPEAVPARPTPARQGLGRRLFPYGLALASAVLAFLGFAGFDLWPLALVAYVPLLFALDEARTRGRRSVLAVATLFAFVANWGGYYWLVHVLTVFSGFPFWLCIVFASVLILYTGGTFIAAFWLWARARDHGWNATLALVAAVCALELVYPLLFPFYYGASFHMLPLVMQVADLGGPLLVTTLAFVVNGALYEVVRYVIRREPTRPWKPAAAALAYVAFVLGYGAWRMRVVDADAAAAPKITVGLVQANMGLLDKRLDPFEGHRRHLDQSFELEERVRPDLIVWPESAFTYFLPDRVANVKSAVLGGLSTPVIFGGLQMRREGGREKHFNTAFSTNGAGDVLGSYDKTYLLAFGEYLPFGEQFPVLYDISRHSGRFTPGTRVAPLPYVHPRTGAEYRIGTMICYEDILPSFVRKLVHAGDPHLFANLTNDAWFGDTTEPWIHLALAKFRAVEHHRALVRVTNSGVSAVVDPAGRVVTHSRTFERATLHAEVAMLSTGRTLYARLGDWPGYLSLLAIGAMAFVRRAHRPATA